MVTDATQTVPQGPQPPLWSEDVAHRMRAHAGRWVAIEEGQLVGVGDSLSQALRDAADSGFTDAVAFRVPAHPERRAAYGVETSGS